MQAKAATLHCSINIMESNYRKTFYHNVLCVFIFKKLVIGYEKVFFDAELTCSFHI